VNVVEHAPTGPPSGVLVVAVPGGTFSPAALDLHVDAVPRTSLVAELAAAGHAVAVVDLPRRGDAWTLAYTAEHVARIAREKAGGRRVIGLGHSLGGAVVVAAAAASGVFDGIAVLGFSPAWESVPGLAAGDDIRERALAALTTADPDRWRGEEVRFPRDADSAFWFAADVGGAARRAVVADEQPLARALAADFGIRSIAERYAASVHVPVLLVFGAVDASPDPDAEAAVYASSPRVDTVRLPGSAHVHVVSRDRLALWDALKTWIPRTAGLAPAPRKGQE
jgi:pimeloyl-ACP methyl ester carboxylesterase